MSDGAGCASPLPPMQLAASVWTRTTTGRVTVDPEWWHGGGGENADIPTQASASRPARIAPPARAGRLDAEATRQLDTGRDANLGGAVNSAGLVNDDGREHTNRDFGRASPSAHPVAPVP